MPEKILVVEDNLQNMKLVLMTLHPYGYNLIEASDGEEALELMEEAKVGYSLQQLPLCSAKQLKELGLLSLSFSAFALAFFQLELRSKPGLLAQFVGSYPIKCTVSFNWYRLNTICIDRVLAALTQ